jgi:hypothetical protein
MAFLFHPGKQPESAYFPSFGELAPSWRTVVPFIFGGKATVVVLNHQTRQRVVKFSKTSPMKAIKTTLADFFAFLKNPAYPQPAQRQAVPVLQTTRVFMAEFSLWGGIGLLWTAVLLGGYWYSQSQSSAIGNVAKGSIEGHLIGGLLLVPMLIEGIFRTPMRLTPKRLGWLTFVALLIVIGLFLKPVERYLGNNAGLMLTISWLLLTGPIIWFVTRSARYARIDAVWQRHFRWVFYVLTGLAAIFYHSAFLSLTGWQVLWLPAVLLPGLLLSACLGYVRLKHGYWYAVAVHGLLNVGPVVVLLMNRA